MKKSIYYLSIVATLFTACNTANNKKAQVIDAEVEGLEYQCAGLVKYTDANGSLSCDHTPVGFKIGEIRLGSIKKIPKDGIILPQDIVGVNRDNLNNENVIKLSVILQSIDSDNNPENGITITKKTREKLSKTPIVLQDMTLDEIKEIIELELDDINFTTPKKSINHLLNSMKRFNIR